MGWIVWQTLKRVICPVTNLPFFWPVRNWKITDSVSQKSSFYKKHRYIIRSQVILLVTRMYNPLLQSILSPSKQRDITGIQDSQSYSPVVRYHFSKQHQLILLAYRAHNPKSRVYYQFLKNTRLWQWMNFWIHTHHKPTWKRLNVRVLEEIFTFCIRFT